METKLYVANLPYAPSALALRDHFGACGVVSDVEIVPDRNAGRGRGTAFVRMSNAAGAERAVSQLNGAPFAGQLLQVQAAPAEPDDRHRRATRKPDNAVPASAARITVQFRERGNMTYELDCFGVAVVIRVSFPAATGRWRVAAEGRRSNAPGAAAEAPSRQEALRGVARACREGTGCAALESVDWDAVENALREVRAL